MFLQKGKERKTPNLVQPELSWRLLQVIRIPGPFSLSLPLHVVLSSVFVWSSESLQSWNRKGGWPEGHHSCLLWLSFHSLLISVSAEHFCLYFFGQIFATWPHLVAREPGWYSLVIGEQCYSKRSQGSFKNNTERTSIRWKPEFSILYIKFLMPIDYS